MTLRLTRQDREIWRLALPALGALVAEPLFLLVDSAVVGHLGTAQLAGLGVAAVLLTTLVTSLVFLAYATTAAVARRIGAQDTAGALRQGVDSLWVALALGLLLAVAGLLAAEPLVAAFEPSPAVTSHAVLYLRISLLGLPAMLLVLAATGVLRGLQDTRTPLTVAGVGFAANAVLNIALVYGVGLGLAGSAIGTVLAQLGMAAAFLSVVVRAARQHRIGLRPDWPGMRSTLTAGLPLVIRTLSMRVTALAATATATSMGDAPLAGHQILTNLWITLSLILDAVAIAGQAITGRQLGAGDTTAVRAVSRRMIGWGVLTGLGCTGLLLAAPLYLPLFTPDPAVAGAVAGAVLVAAALQPLCGVVFVLDGILIGAGDGRYLAWASLAATGCFLPAAWAVAVYDGGLAALWWATGLWIAARLVALLHRFAGSSWLVTGAVRG